MGHPFAQGFIKNESQILEDISNCDISTQLGDNLFKGSYMTDAPGSTARSIAGVNSEVPDGQDSNANAHSTKSVGIHNGILQQMYEQLLGSAPERFDISANKTSLHAASDASGNDADAGTIYSQQITN